MKNWILSFAFLISSLPASPCSWFPGGEEIRFSLFSSSMANVDDASDLFYSAHFFNEYLVDAYSGPTENLKEWESYFGGEVSIEEIDQLIYGFPIQKSNEGIEKNELMKHFNQGFHGEAGEYIFFAKNVEYQLYYDLWGEKDIDVDALEKSAIIAEERCINSSDQVLKLRYAYQLMVINYYLNDPDAAQHVYKKYVLTSPTNSVIKDWCMFYYANTLEDPIERLYVLSRVFDNCKSKSRYIFQVFPTDKSKVNEVLKRCKNDKEKAAVLSLVAFKNPARAKDQIVEIAKLNPTSELLDLLLIREINKIEDWYFTDRYTSYGTGITSNCYECDQFKFIDEKNFLSDKKYLKNFMIEIEDIVAKSGIKNRGLWFTSLAYMAYMLDDNEATKKFGKLGSIHSKTDQIDGQLEVISLMNNIKHNQIWDLNFQTILMDQIKEIDLYKDEIYRYEHFRGQMMLAISRKYLEEENVVVAALFESKVSGNVVEPYMSWWNQRGYQAFDLLNENATSKDLDELFELWNKKNKTELEEFLFSDMETYKWRITDLWATQYFREDKLKKALNIYETIPDSVWRVHNEELHYYYNDELDSDPFESSFYSNSKWELSDKRYTKPEFVKEIIRLKGLIDGPVKDKAYNALLLGNAYYNMTHSGNSYYYTEYSWTSWGNDDFKRNNDYYYNAERAREYYILAESLAPNKAFAAFCHRMKIKCTQTSYFDYEEYKTKKALIEKEWEDFAQVYPEHSKFLTNCDKFEFYSNAWKL
jgi:hypothetical protein